MKKPAFTSVRPKAYSYVRFSTPEQSKGDSFRRQSEAALAYAQKHDLDLDLRVNFHDLGVSAYTGKNAETGALRAFIDAVNKGQIEEGSFLLVESLDRISRASILHAQMLFVQIITSGITLVTLADGRCYSEESINANPSDFLISLVVLMRGNDESATKARRVKAAWANKRKQVSEGKLLTKLVPGWIRVTEDGKREAIPERAAVVQRIFALFLAGTGKGGIAKLLNLEGVPPWGSVSRKPGKHWHASYIAKILSNPATTGTLVLKTVETERGRAVSKAADEVEGYYPQVIDPQTFARVGAIRDTNTSSRKRGAAPARNLLAGLSSCPLCSGAMIRVNKGAGGKSGKPYLVCSRAKVGGGCSYKAVSLANVEAAVRHSTDTLANALLSEGSENLAKEVQNLEMYEFALTDELANVARAIRKSGHSPALAREVRTLETQLEAASASLREKRATLYTQTHAMRRARIDDLVASMSNTDDPAPSNILLRELFRTVVVNYSTRELEFQTKAGGVITITYEMEPAEDQPTKEPSRSPKRPAPKGQ